MRICVYGASSNDIDNSFIVAIEKFGENLAKRGHSLVFGCGKHGLMGAVSRGVKRQGGFVHGVIPRFFEENKYDAIMYDADDLTWTDTMAQRKEIMENDCKAFVIVPGGIGTFEELFQIITLKQLCQHDKPIAIYNVNGFYNDLYAFLEQIVEKKFMHDRSMKLFKLCNTEEEIFDYIENYYNQPREKREFKKTTEK